MCTDIKERKNMLSPTDPKIKNNLPKIKEIIMKENVRLYFIPSPLLCSLVAQGEHPLLKKMPNARKIELLSGDGVFIQKLLVWNWLNNKLDERNSFILANGEVRVVDNSITSHAALITNRESK